jgi:TonB family protein
MSAVASLALNRDPRRIFPRYPVKVALDVIVLRSGVPQTLPGRCADLGEGGVGAMVAGELLPGQQVGVEVRLPNVGLPLRARATVRYQGAARCGFEFMGLTAEQREMIYYWAQRLTAEASKAGKAQTKAEAAKVGAPAIVRPAARKIRIPRLRLEFIVAAVLGMLVLAAAGWWQWQRSWSELETSAAGQTAPLRVSPEIMTTRIVSKVEPVYPEEARRAGKQGMVVLDALIAADGTVRRLQPISGDDVLAKSASDAVRQWRFEPYRSAGRGLEVETSIAVEFRLN